MRRRRRRHHSVPVGTKHPLCDDAIVLRVRADPKPQEPVRRIHPDRAVVGTDTGRVEPTNAFEMQGGVPRVRLQERELLVCERPDVAGQRIVTRPEARRGVMRQSLRE